MQQLKSGQPNIKSPIVSKASIFQQLHFIRTLSEPNQITHPHKKDREKKEEQDVERG